MTPNQPNLARRALLLLSALLLPGSFPLQAANPHDGASPARNPTKPSNPETALRTVPPEEEPLSGTPRRREHLAPRDRAQHTVFANAGYLAILSAFYFEESSSGSLNSGFDLMAGYNWTSRRGLGVGIHLLGRLHLRRTGCRQAHDPPALHRPGVRRPTARRPPVALPRGGRRRLRPLRAQLRRTSGQPGRSRHPRTGFGRIHADAPHRTLGRGGRAVAHRPFAGRRRRGRTDAERHPAVPMQRRHTPLFLKILSKNLKILHFAG